jgi:hypothetical protein
MVYSHWLVFTKYCSGWYGDSLSDIHPCVLLVIPDSNYNTKVPLLIGTNILQPIMDFYKEQHGTRFLQSSNLTTPWYLTFRSIALREKELGRHNNALAIVKNAVKKPVAIKPPISNGTLVL